METCFTYTDNYAFFSSDERKWINKIRKLQQSNPDEVTILAEPEKNDGCIYCQVPAHWLKLQPPRNLSDEQREAARERMRVYRSQL